MVETSEVTHTAILTFVGNNVDLSIQYVDVLLCTKS
jgi:hypothetical protein